MIRLTQMRKAPMSSSGLFLTSNPIISGSANFFASGYPLIDVGFVGQGLDKEIERGCRYKGKGKLPQESSNELADVFSPAATDHGTELFPTSATAAVDSGMNEAEYRVSLQLEE